MATTAFLSAVPEISALVSGCPTAILERYVSKVVIELCRRASVWRVLLPPMPLTSGVYTYTPTTPTDTVLHNILTATLSLGSPVVAKSLRIYTDVKISKMYPMWPDTVNVQQPLAIFQSNPATINVYPVPDTITAYKINLLAILRPTATAAGWDSALQDEFREVIYHGVLYYIMMMNNRVWSDPAGAQMHGKIYTNLVADARAKANKSYTRADLYVTQRPWA